MTWMNWVCISYIISVPLLTPHLSSLSKKCVSCTEYDSTVMQEVKSCSIISQVVPMKSSKKTSLVRYQSQIHLCRTGGARAFWKFDGCTPWSAFKTSGDWFPHSHLSFLPPSSMLPHPTKSTLHKGMFFLIIFVTVSWVLVTVYWGLHTGTHGKPVEISTGLSHVGGWVPMWLILVEISTGVGHVGIYSCDWF